MAEKPLNTIKNPISSDDFGNLDAENGVKKSRDLLCFFLKMTISKAILEGKSKELGIKSSAKLMVCIWKKRGLIRKVTDNQWVKAKH